VIIPLPENAIFLQIAMPGGNLHLQWTYRAHSAFPPRKLIWYYEDRTRFLLQSLIALVDLSTVFDDAHQPPAEGMLQQVGKNCSKRLRHFSLSLSVMDQHGEPPMQEVSNNSVQEY
jgi:hypothetical protein